MINIDRRGIANFDWFLFGLVLLISIIGVMTLYSATRPIGGEEGANFYFKQLFWLGIAIATLLVFVGFDYSWLERLSTPLYVIGIIGLVAVLAIGKAGMGAKRWIHLGPLNIQPSEFFKIVFVTVIAVRFSRIKDRLTVKDIIKTALLYVIPPAVLIIKEPDLGTSMIIVIAFCIIALIRGIHKKALIILVVLGIISAPFVDSIVWSKLKSYQKNRLIAFWRPQADPSGIGYQIEQSKITIGSGRFWGKGYLKGTQGPFRFLPEKHTDFIFSVFAEEWGLGGCIFLLTAYLLLLLRGLDTALKSKDGFGRLLAVSIVIMFFIYLVINIGMALGIMPVVGAPLPFMSYGGTALISNFAAVGILINVRMRRFALFY